MRMLQQGLVLVLALAACSKPADQTRNANTQPAKTNCPADNAQITVPDGFCVTVFADTIGEARHVVVNSNGDVYVNLQKQKQVVGLRDSTHDGVADQVVRFGAGGGTGIGIYNGYLYVDEMTRITRYKLDPQKLAPAANAEVVVANVPGNPGHIARNFAIAGDGSLYLNVGSATNSCQKQDRTPNSPGIDPCTELATRAGTWKFDANKLNQQFTPSARFATGIRNGMGLTFAPDGKLYGTQHGRDQLTDDWKNVFPDPRYQAENPAEEFFQINQGDDFGWPYCYYAMDQKKLVNAPEYGGDGKKADRCTTKKEPIQAFPGHWAPMSLLFYTGSQFPAKYRSGVFISFHGSWNRAPEPQAGYKVVFLPLNNYQSSGNYETFADGFAQLTGMALQPGEAKHRPVGLAQAPDGALFISDDAGGRIYRITYGGSK